VNKKRIESEINLNQNSSQAELSYYILRNLVFEAYAGDRGAFGGDLLWIFRY